MYFNVCRDLESKENISQDGKSSHRHAIDNCQQIPAELAGSTYKYLVSIAILGRTKPEGHLCNRKGEVNRFNMIAPGLSEL